MTLERSDACSQSAVNDIIHLAKTLALCTIIVETLNSREFAVFDVELAKADEVRLLEPGQECENPFVRRRLAALAQRQEELGQRAADLHQRLRVLADGRRIFPGEAFSQAAVREHDEICLQLDDVREEINSAVAPARLKQCWRVEYTWSPAGDRTYVRPLAGEPLDSFLRLAEVDDEAELARAVAKFVERFGGLGLCIDHSRPVAYDRGLRHDATYLRCAQGCPGQSAWHGCEPVSVWKRYAHIAAALFDVVDDVNAGKRAAREKWDQLLGPQGMNIGDKAVEDQGPVHWIAAGQFQLWLAGGSLSLTMRTDPAFLLPVWRGTVHGIVGLQMALRAKQRWYEREALQDGRCILCGKELSVGTGADKRRRSMFAQYCSRCAPKGKRLSRENKQRGYGLYRWLKPWVEAHPSLRWPELLNRWNQAYAKTPRLQFESADAMEREYQRRVTAAKRRAAKRR